MQIPLFNEISTTSSHIAPVIVMARQYGGHGSDEPDGFGYAVDYYEMRTEALAIRYEKELRNQIGDSIPDTYHKI